ncbi:MAG TPA: tRNA pseudouridine(55) synthase TruB [Nocardioidaceae bacterium]|nr:tRNA pseudouridine(55) synthase TruB [Nocardioidaceae bacterium]
MDSSLVDGVVVVDKPAGLTSHDVVAQVRRALGTRKVGHAGTLDPMATGVLVLGVGRATRLLGHLMLTEKAYDATVRLGVATSTDDAEGEVVATISAARLDVAEVAASAATFVGDLQQVPSSVSAVKVDGERAYRRVRAGEKVELAARPVTVHSLELHRVRPADDCLDVDVSVRCSSGTYVRAIGRDLGEVLGVGGHLTALRRTAVGPFALAEATPLHDITEHFDMVTMAQVARRCFATYMLDAAQARDVGFGRKLAVELPESGPVAMLDATGGFLALYEQRGPVAAPVAVFAASPPATA